MRTRAQELVLAMILTLLPACGDSTRPSPPWEKRIFGLAPTAVSDPIISPLDSTIGFNHTAILSLYNDDSYYYADYADTGRGFWLIEWDGSNPRRAGDYLSDVSVSPDGVTLLYIDGGVKSIRLSNGEFEPGSRIEYTFAGTFWGPKWDPTMTKMAAWSSGPIYTDPGVYIWNSINQDWHGVGETGWREPD
jgi:hypothetical protein